MPLVVDNTIASPYVLNPLRHGADVVVHSTTKYLGGHSDVVGGALIVNDDALAEKIGFLQYAVGAVSGPLDAWLTTRGIKTLAVRMQRHSENAAAVAAFLEGHERVARVYYPGLASHPQHERAKRLFRSASWQLSFELADAADCLPFIDRLSLPIIATGLGDTRTLIIPVAHTIFWEMGPERRASMGIADSLIRVSVGIEESEDILADFAAALAQS